MANEAAIRLARAFTGKQHCQSENPFEFRANVLAFPGSYHGNTFLLQHLDSLERLQPITAAIIIEGYEGWSARFHDAKMIQNIRRFCSELGVVLIFDEIQSGFGRTGRMFAFEHYGIEPDLVTFGKGVSSSLPLSGVLGRKDIMECLDGKELISNTHSGSPLCCVAAKASLEEYLKLELSEIWWNGDKIGKRLRKLMRDHSGLVSEICGRGAVFAIHFFDKDVCDKITELCIKQGLMLVRTRRGTIKLGPPLTMPLEVWSMGIDGIDEVMSKYENSGH